MTRSWWNSLPGRKSKYLHGNSARMPVRSRREPALERLEERCVLSSFRTIDGTGNNASNPEWGSAGVDLVRKAPAAYADVAGLNDPVVGSPARPSPREISNVVVAQTTDERVLSDRFMSAMIYGWGQFIDHDMDLTPNDSPAVPFSITVPDDPTDPFSAAYEPPAPGVIDFNRSDYDPNTGKIDASGKPIPRQQPNVITAFLDASMVYGSSDFVASALRANDGTGRLKTSPGADGVIGTDDDLLPLNNQTYFPGVNQVPADPDAAFAIANDARRVPDHDLFMAGDVRVNENVELTSLHTLFVREHNRIADAIHAASPKLSDELIYQRARAMVGAEIQSITYNQWLPTLLGGGALKSYAGYNPRVNPGIANEFSTAGFRLGHSMLGDQVEFLDNDGEEVRANVPLNDAFFNPPLLTETGIGPILKYLASDPSSEIDNSIVDPVRNFLFGPPGAGGFDLASLNIQRGRDHGLADYNSVRAAYGLPQVTSFAQITSDPALQAELQTLYSNVNNIDLWVGGLAEDHIPGSSTGQLLRAIIKDQFERLRDGDSFWYQRAFSGATLKTLDNTTLADIITRNTEIDNLQNNVFSFRLSISGTVYSDADRDGRRDPREAGISGREIRLISVEENGDTILLATATTDAKGFYKFDVGDRMELGTYRVLELLPLGVNQTTSDPDDIEFTRGGQFAIGVNFGNAPSLLAQLSNQLLLQSLASTTSSSTAAPTAASGQVSDAINTQREPSRQDLSWAGPRVTSLGSGDTSSLSTGNNVDDGAVNVTDLDRFFAALSSLDSAFGRV